MSFGSTNFGPGMTPPPFPGQEPGNGGVGVTPNVPPTASWQAGFDKQVAQSQKAFKEQVKQGQARFDEQVRRNHTGFEENLRQGQSSKGGSGNPKASHPSDETFSQFKARRNNGTEHKTEKNLYGDVFLDDMAKQNAKALRRMQGFNHKIFSESIPGYDDMIKRRGDNWTFHREDRQYSQGQKTGDPGAKEKESNGQKRDNSFGGGHEQSQKNQEVRREEEKSEPDTNIFEKVAMSELGINEKELEIMRAPLTRPTKDQLASFAKKVFGVADGFDKDEVKTSYRKLSSLWHPDKGGNATNPIVAEKFKIVNALYEKYRSVFT